MFAGAGDGESDAADNGEDGNPVEKEATGQHNRDDDPGGNGAAVPFVAEEESACVFAAEAKELGGVGGVAAVAHAGLSVCVG